MRGRGKILFGLTALLALCVFVATAFADSPPTITTDPATAVTATTAQLSGTVNPEGGPSETNWHFEYTTEPSGFFWSTGPSGEFAGTEAEGTDPVDVGGTIEGLEPETKYTFRLVAQNEFGVNFVRTPEPFPTFTTPAGTPEIQNAAVAPLADEALFDAEVNPLGKATYHVEYGATTAYGHVTASRQLKKGATAVPVEVGIFGLSPNTTYHARLVVENAAETVRSGDQEFTTRSPEAGGLPDGRVYEQVSPQIKNGNDAGATSPSTAPKYAIATANGEGILYGVRGPMGAAHRGLQDYAIGHRTADGWTSEPATPAGSAERIYALSYAPKDLLPSADLSRIVFGAFGSYVPENPETLNTSAGLYLGRPDGAIEWLTRPRIADPNPAPGEIPNLSIMEPAGASPDLSTVYFWSGPTLLPEDAARSALYNPNDPEGAGPYGLYEYTDGVLKEAGTLPNGEDSAGGAAPAAQGGYFRVSGNLANPNTVGNQVSRDGSTLWFVSPDPGPLSGGVKQTELYVRHGGRSTLVSHDQSGAPAPSGVSGVEGRAPGADPAPDIYAYASPDGSTAIFKSVDALAPGAPNDSSVKSYMYDRADDTVTYLPGVSGWVVTSSDDGQRFLFGDSDHIAVWDHGTVTQISSVGGSELAPARATGDGSVFIFSTQAQIPGFNSGSMVQIYRYETATQKTTCLSCPPDGVTPSGYAHFMSFSGEGQVLGNRGMTTDASRVFFDTPDPLVARDTNGKRDVYEWEEGHVSLISTGRSKEDSFFLDNSADGRNVFFATTEGLVPGDTDEAYDVYDARVGGGFGNGEESAPCQGEACKGEPGSPPTIGAAASSRLNGSGNVRPATGVGISGIQKISSSDLARLAKGGKARLHLKVSGPGNINLTGKAKVGKKTLRAVSASFKAKKAGKVAIPFSLTKGALSALGRQGRLPVSLTVRFKGAGAKVVKFTVRAAGSAKGGAR